MAKVKDFFKRLLGSKQEARRRLVSEDPTKHYRPPRNIGHELIIDELPLFTVRTARLMLRDPVVSIGLSTRNAALLPAEVKVECKDAVVREYIGRQWKTIWQHHAPEILRTKIWGFNGIQVDYKFDKSTGFVEVEGIKEFSPHDVRCMTHEGKAVGFKVVPSYGSSQGSERTTTTLYAPQACWLTYDGMWGAHYGHSILRKCYSPWYEKWMPHGAIKTRQLRMIKDSYMGDVVQYPFDRDVHLPDGTVVSWRDILREMAESRMAGATLMLPQVLDASGQKLIEYQPPQDTGNPTGIYQWVEDSDRDIWRGLDVFEEVIQAAEVGSGFSGRSIPLVMFLSACQDELRQIVAALDKFIFRPMVWHNFERDVDYQITPVPLVETFSDDMGDSGMGGGSIGGGPQPQPAKPNGPQPQQGPQSFPPKQMPVQFAEDGFTLIDYDVSDQIAARTTAALRRAMAISKKELWAEVRKQQPSRGVRERLTGTAARLAVIGAIVALLTKKQKKAQAIAEDGLFETSVAGAALAQEFINRTQGAATSGVPAQPPTYTPSQPDVAVVPPAIPPVAAPSPQAPGVPTPPDSKTPTPQGEVPPDKPTVPSTDSLFGRRKRLRFPNEEAARKKLRNSPALAGQNYKETAKLVKQDAFAITTKMSDDVVAQIRDKLEENMESGADLRSFIREVEKIQKGQEFPLSRARIELVFRANTASYLSNAADAALRSPLVADQFPYRVYSATHDDRVRDTHLRLENTGLNGTNVYRGDDPAWQAFRPPWDYNCRCAWRPLTVDQAAKAGVVEANLWMGRANSVANVQGGVAAQYLYGTAPASPARVVWPTIEGVEFYPSAEWTRTAQFSEFQRGLFGDEFDEQPKPKRNKKDYGGDKGKQGMLWTGLDLLPGQRDFLDEGAETQSAKDDDFERKHPRAPAGDSHGGEFVSKESANPGQSRTIQGNPGESSQEIQGNPESGKPETEQPKTYDDSPKATGERIKKALADASEPMTLHELGKLIGVKPGKPEDPLSSPLNRALVALKDAGDVEVIESKSGHGEPRFAIAQSVQFYESAPTAPEAKKKPKQGQWKKVGGSSVYVVDGTIVKGCPGLKGEKIADIIDESDASRAEREKRQEGAEARGLDGEDVTAEEAEDLGDDFDFGANVEPEGDPAERYLDEAGQWATEQGYSPTVVDDDPEGLQAAMDAGKKPAEYAHARIAEWDSQFSPGATPNPVRKGTKLYADLQDAIGDDEDDIQYLHEVLQDVLRVRRDEAEQFNSTLNDFLYQWGKHRKGKAGGYVNKLRAAADPSQVEGFDEIVQMFRDNPQYQSVLQRATGESEGDGDMEARVFDTLREGTKRRVPTLNDPEIWNEAMDIVEATMQRASTWDPDEDDSWRTEQFAEPVAWIDIYRRYRHEFLQFGQPLLFEKHERPLFREEDHPRAPEGSADGKYKGGRFVPKDTPQGKPQRKAPPAPYEQKQAFGPDGLPIGEDTPQEKPQETTKDTPQEKPQDATRKAIADPIELLRSHTRSSAPQFHKNGATNQPAADKLAGEIQKALPHAIVRSHAYKGRMMLEVFKLRSRGEAEQVKSLVDKHGIVQAPNRFTREVKETPHIVWGLHDQDDGSYVLNHSGMLAKGEWSTDTVQLRGIKPEHAAEIARGVDAVLKDMPHVKLQSIMWQPSSKGATLGYYQHYADGKDGEIFFTQKAVKQHDPDKHRSHLEAVGANRAIKIEIAKESADRYRKQGDEKTADYWDARVAVLESCVRWTFADDHNFGDPRNADKRVMLVAAHETSHAVYYQSRAGLVKSVQQAFRAELDNQYGKEEGAAQDTDALAKQLRSERYMDKYRLGEYAATTGIHEQWAEIGAAIAIGEQDKVPPKMLAAYNATIAQIKAYHGGGKNDAK